VTYGTDLLMEEVSYVAYHFHWPLDAILDPIISSITDKVPAGPMRTLVGKMVAPIKDLITKEFKSILQDALNGAIDSITNSVSGAMNAGINSAAATIKLDIHNALDVDATVLYALGRTSGAQNLTQEDLAAAANSPYDTYTHQGLPPGPISNPGAAAISACVNPQQRDQHYLFYFADCQGKTHFAKSEAEFESQLKQYGVVGNGC